MSGNSPPSQNAENKQHAALSSLMVIFSRAHLRRVRVHLGTRRSREDRDGCQSRLAGTCQEGNDMDAMDSVKIKDMRQP